MSTRLRGVVIGCGNVGATFEMTSALPKPASHAAALEANPDTELVGLIDPDAASRERAGAYYGVPTYPDPEMALTQLRPDIVIIATPPGTHESLLALAIASGARAVICEKPLADSLEAGSRMLALAKDSATPIILNHQRRFFPLFAEARIRLAAGALGEIQQVTGYYTNGLLNNGTHLLDAVQFLLDDRPSWAIGLVNEKNIAAPFGRNIDGMVRFTKGAILSLQSLDNDSYGVHDLRIFGTAGVLTVGQYGYTFSWTPLRNGVTFAGLTEPDWAATTVKKDERSMLAGTLAHAVACVADGAVPQSTLLDGYHTMQVLAALEESATAGGTRVSITQSL
jgi:predicted dehydrogenase